jgi:hypothetical protein
MPDLRSSRGSALSVGGNLEPIEPVYTKPNTSNPLATGSPYPIPSEPVSNRDQPIVRRGQNTAGMRYLYSDARNIQPLSRLGTGTKIGIAVAQSFFQPYLGVLRDYGFYDKLYQAGYPGFNLGISFKVPKSPQTATNGPGFNIKGNAPPMNFSLNVLRRNSNVNVTG